MGAAFVLISGDSLSWPLVLAMLACSLLLVIGALAWRMELEGLKGNSGYAERMLPGLARARLPALALAAASVPAAVFEQLRDGGWSPSAIATAVLAALAVLEYVNYYMVQLQHFDHLADFRRLVSGRGFHEAHLAKALRRWRQGGNLS